LYQFGAYADQFGIGPGCFQAVNSAAGGLFKFPGCDGWTQKSTLSGLEKWLRLLSINLEKEKEFLISFRL
jgi:hypothetical protein